MTGTLFNIVGDAVSQPQDRTPQSFRRSPTAALCCCVTAKTVAVCVREQAVLAFALIILMRYAKQIVLVPPALATRLSTIRVPLEIDHVIVDKSVTNCTTIPDTVVDLLTLRHIANETAFDEDLNSMSCKSIVFATSGTGGEPHFVKHYASDLFSDLRGRRPSTAQLVWGSLYCFDRFAGFQVFLQALKDSSTLIVTNCDDSIQQRLEHLITYGCSALSGTPTMWRRLLMVPRHKHLALKQISLGGEIADGFLLKALRHAFTAARITHIYASTEAGSVFAIHDGLPGFPIDLLNRSEPHRVLQIRDGRLFIKRASGSGLYEATSRTFRDALDFIDTGDCVEIHGDRVYFLGRSSTVINIGGNKLHPEELERTISAIPDVAAVRVATKRSSVIGDLVVAEVVPATTQLDELAFIKSVRDYCLARIEAWKIPSIFRVVDSISVNTAGKITRWTNGRSR